jgi:hypothetical protein
MKILNLFVAITLICFALSQTTEAVNPPPDGDYPGQNTAEGQSALFDLSACAQIVIDSGTNGNGKVINGFLNDQYKWSDSTCHRRSVALARNDTSKGGNAKQFTYVLPNGTTRTVNPGYAQAGGFGYIVAHLSNPSFAWSYNADDSPLGSGDSATFQKIFSGRHHAIYQYTLNYVRYGLTQDALTNHSIDPWTWINGPNDPNRQYVTRYDMPVRIQWMFATGRDYPVWSVTFDLSGIPNHAVDSDFRAPYGDMKIEGGSGLATVAGVAWGDKYRFATLGSPFTMDNAWTYNQINPGAPYDSLWTVNIDAEMGLAGTQVTALQNAGGYNNYQAPIWRGHTSANMGQICVNDEGAGHGYDHRTPCTGDWAYQLIQYSVASAGETTNDKRLAWGADWGSLGNGGPFTSSNGYNVRGWPRVSYSVCVVLDPHSKNPTQRIALQAKTIRLTQLTATVGTVRTTGRAGVGRSDNKTYIPAGYSPIFSTWEVNTANGNATLKFVVPPSAPSTLDAPIVVLHNYASAALPRVYLNNVLLAANSDYFASLRPGVSELWLTLNRKLSGTHTLRIVH